MWKTPRFRRKSFQLAELERQREFSFFLVLCLVVTVQGSTHGGMLGSAMNGIFIIAAFSLCCRSHAAYVAERNKLIDCNPFASRNQSKLAQFNPISRLACFTHFLQTNHSRKVSIRNARNSRWKSLDMAEARVGPSFQRLGMLKFKNFKTDCEVCRTRELLTESHSRH